MSFLNTSTDLVVNDTFLGSNPELKEFDYNSFYRAYVESIDDPDNLGRIKVRIPALHGNKDQQNSTPTSNLPFAYPACFTGFGNQVGPFYLPPVGSVVFVTFEYSDEHRIIYFGGVPTKAYEGKKQSYGVRVNNGQQKDVTLDDIPKEYSGSQSIIYKSPQGNIIYMDDADYNLIYIGDKEGKFIELGIAPLENGTTYHYYRNRISDNAELWFDEEGFTLTLNNKTYKITNEVLDRLFPN